MEYLSIGAVAFKSLENLYPSKNKSNYQI